MEKDKEWKRSEEEDEEIAEEVNSSLERRKKKGSIGAVNGEKHSVFFEADEGAEFNNDKDFPKLGEKNEIFVSENTIQNGNAYIEANDLITHNTVDAEKDNHHELGNLVPKSHYGSAVNNGNQSRRDEDQIQESTELKPEIQTKLIVQEYDIEKIIGEQETHDLFCPNCHSCITKRVILHKRKRTRENKNDLPPEKVQHVPEVNPASVEVEDQEDKTVFRCLSCLSFFIPTEGSFNIFRLFGKKDGSSNSRNSEKKPTQNENQVPLLSGSKNNDNKAAMGDSYPSHGQMFDQDQKNEPNYSATTMLPDRSTAESYSNGVQMNNSAQQAKPTYASIVSKDTSAEKQTSDGALVENMEEEDKHSFPHTIVQNNMLDTSTGIPDPIGGLKGNKTQGDKTRYPVQAISGGPSNGAPYTNGIVIGTLCGNPSNLASILSDGVYTSNANLNGSTVAVTGYISSGNDVTKPVNIMQSATPTRATTETNQISYGSDATSATDTLIDMGTHGMVSSSRAYEWDILKSIVYGGLIESIMSLSLVASAAGAGSPTINICALGLANLVGGLFLLAHDLSELRIRHDTETSNQIGQQPSQYWEKLGKREHAKCHICISVLSFIIFGALPPIIYAFTFRRSNHKEHKIIAMATSSLFCIAVLAAGKAHVKSQNGYLKSVFYYLGIALPASGLSYAAGVMIHRLFVELSLFDPTINSPSLQLLSSY